MIEWSRLPDGFVRPGYEVSSQGDRRFSAFFAKLPTGWRIEDAYQIGVKGYPTARAGKGQPTRRGQTREQLWIEYLALWQEWAARRPALLEYLHTEAKANGSLLTDMFATTPINQAHALATILNERYTAASRP